MTCKKQYPFGTVYCSVCGSKLVIGKLAAKSLSDQKPLEKTSSFTRADQMIMEGETAKVIALPNTAHTHENQPKSRGVLLTSWLIISLLANGLMAFAYIGASINYAIGVSTTLSNMPFFLLPIFTIFSILNVCAIIALFKWKKWGFYAICISAIVAFVANVAFVAFTLAFVGLFGLLILGLLLHSKESFLE